MDPGEGDADAVARILIQEAQSSVAPMRIVAREQDGEWVVDFAGVVDEYSSGPSLLLAVLAAEQRYLVEQEGRGSVRGKTYLDKAAERIRRGPTANPAAHAQ